LRYCFVITLSYIMTLCCQ